MGRHSSASLSPGFRFHPTDEELVRYYLRRKVSGKSFRFDPIAVIDIYKSEPWDLPCKSKLKSRDLEWYFFSGLDKKYGNGSKTNRATEKGYWKTTGKDRQVRHNSRIVGMKKTLVFHVGRAPRGTRTNWVMHEYRLEDEELVKAGIAQKDAFVLCRVFQKSGTGPKNGEQYGAPFVEEEWEDEDDEVAPLPGEGAVTDELLFGNDIDAFLETDDLEQALDMGVASESTGLPVNFCHGESSSYPVHSQELTEDQKPLVSTVGSFKPQEDQFLNTPEQCAMDRETVKDEYNGEQSDDGNPLNIDHVFDELYLDAIDYSQVDDGSFLETNDLAIPIAADPDGTNMLDEYLTYLDANDDIFNYISFDSPPLIKGSEDSAPDQVPPFTQQNVDEETKVSYMESKQNVETPYNSIEASSSKQIPGISKSVSGNTSSFIKKANNLLGSIPAPQAFAADSAPKDIALRLHSAAQSSFADHITTGMIRVTNITVRGDGIDWTLGKNGELNFMISSDFSQLDVNSAASVPVSGSFSGKTAFLVSHCWVFVMLFSVLILSLSCKGGSFMYAGK
ncbi:NAC domain-containing protein 78-like [Senna tora]|uniref:NAC domain-containing protein 78-like n=1 Tax=Senna tora TaxID=362788 RepID=A0A834TF92_9FABA|nr:NAC domain-containing protein 78-like [Senna tora]